MHLQETGLFLARGNSKSIEDQEEQGRMKSEERKHHAIRHHGMEVVVVADGV